MGSLTNCHSFLCVCAYMHTHVSYSATELQMNLRRGLICQGPLSAQRYLDILSLFVIIFYFICLTTLVGVWNRSLGQNSLISLLWATFRPFPHKHTVCWSTFSPPHLHSSPCSQPCALLLAPLAALDGCTSVYKYLYICDFMCLCKL